MTMPGKRPASDVVPPKPAATKIRQQPTHPTRKLLGCLSLASLLLSTQQAASADVDGIPYNPDFPRAQFPYAQAPDGCSGISSPREVRDTWGSVNFTGACNTHDRCYYTLGQNSQACNSEFYDRLRAACERDTPWYLFATALPACYSLASAYYAGVQAGVMLDVFRAAQNLQSSYFSWIAQNGYKRCSELPGYSGCIATASTSQGQSAIKFCNKTADKTIYGAYASFDEPNGWTSHGWYKVDPGNCNQVSIGRPYNGDIFVYAEHNGGATFWGGEHASFCLNRTEAFNIANADKFCDGAHLKKVGMTRFGIRSGVNTWSFNP